MKYLILFLIVLQAFANPVKDLEDAFFKKSSELEAEHEKKTLSLANSYLKALEKRLSAYTKKGDFDNATLIKGKILEIRKQLPKIHDKITGSWKWETRNHWIAFQKESHKGYGTWHTSGEKIKGTWIWLYTQDKQIIETTRIDKGKEVKEMWELVDRVTLKNITHNFNVIKGGRK